MFFLFSCKSGSGKEQKIDTGIKANAGIKATAVLKADTPNTSFTGEVPILCYHQIRDWKTTDSKSARTYILPVEKYKEEIKMLHDSGYHTILPDQLVAYMERGEQLPDHPIMLTYDDADGSQYMSGLPELDKAGFKGVFFIMTVVLNRPDYMSRKEVRALDSMGHVIGCHTWNHEMVTKYDAGDWVKQLEKPTADLQRITGKPVKYFAYPDGIWNSAAIPYLKKNGYTAAFQLWGKSDQHDPIFTVKRILVSGYFDNKDIMRAIHRSERRKEEMLSASNGH
jgi:peptidoglycan/xylan/chitin deacetylase (PgdA/CDA1 family)